MESEFQADLIKDLRKMFPGCIILKNDPTYLQGFPDLIILYGNRWAVLEAKESSRSRHRPNQDYYVDLAYDMSYGSFIYPENKEKVLHELQQAL
jgi:hypothetical protein